MSLERRSRQRFPLDLPLHFAVKQGRRETVQGSGTVTNIGSKGLAFHTDMALRPGLEIHAAVNWPVTLSGRCGLKIAIGGRILRCSQGEVVMSVEKYEFRTDGRPKAQKATGGA